MRKKQDRIQWTKNISIYQANDTKYNRRKNQASRVGKEIICERINNMEFYGGNILVKEEFLFYF